MSYNFDNNERLGYTVIRSISFMVIGIPNDSWIYKSGNADPQNLARIGFTWSFGTSGFNNKDGLTQEEKNNFQEEVVRITPKRTLVELRKTELLTKRDLEMFVVPKPDTILIQIV